MDSRLTAMLMHFFLGASAEGHSGTDTVAYRDARTHLKTINSFESCVRTLGRLDEIHLDGEEKVDNDLLVNLADFCSIAAL